MSISLECIKLKRTGFFPALLCGGILAAAVPVLNMTIRWKTYVVVSGNPIQILLDANWQMMAMLNVLFIVAGTCLLYHTEYADNAIQKIKSLPVRESSVFYGKAILTIFMSALMLAIEAGAITFCAYKWFEIQNTFWRELCKSFAYAFWLMLPCIVLSLLISQSCKNMWISLGMGVIFVFTATMLPPNNFILSLFPFAAPFQIFMNADMTWSMGFVCATAAELIVLDLAELILIRVRRWGA